MEYGLDMSMAFAGPRSQSKKIIYQSGTTLCQKLIRIREVPLLISLEIWPAPEIPERSPNIFS